MCCNIKSWDYQAPALVSVLRLEQRPKVCQLKSTETLIGKIDFCPLRNLTFEASNSRGASDLVKTGGDKKLNQMQI